MAYILTIVGAYVCGSIFLQGGSSMERITEITAREKEIWGLRQSGWTFRKIASKYQLSASRVSVQYRQILRKQREHNAKQFREEQSKHEVSVRFTLSEIVILQRILSNYAWSAMNRELARVKNKYVTQLEKEDIDYITAQKLSYQLHEIEATARLFLKMTR